MVTTICYGKKDVWPTRQKAMDFFWEGMIACLGSSEGERYGRIYSRLAAGADIATDEDVFNREEN